MGRKLNNIYKKIIIVFVLILNFSCIERNDGQLTEQNIILYKENILLRGDKYSYSRLLIHYKDIDRTIELIPYSILMANIYNNPDANKQMYFDLIKLYNKGVYNDSLIFTIKNKEMIINYLKKSANLGDEEAIKILNNIEKNHFKN